MSNTLLAQLPNYTDTCGCSLLEGRCPDHRTKMQEIHRIWSTSRNADMLEVLWSMSDGYGSVGYMPEQGYDWSGIRDSSCGAIDSMWAAIHA